MKTLYTILILAFALPLSAKDLTCKIVGVSDGDTVTCLTAEKEQIKIRLYQIDAPESGQDFGQRSKQALSNMIFSKQVTIKTHGQDRYKRTVGTIYLGNKDINLEMIKQGMAWVYPQFAKDKVYFAAHDQAKAGKVGLWQQAAIPPWEWRKNKTGQQNTQSTKNTAFTCGTKQYCRQMSSRDEAKFYLKTCGVTSLDGNNDGVPCNSLCRK